MSLRDHLQAIFDADRALRDAEADLLKRGRDTALATLLSDAVTEASKLDDRAEGAMRLIRLADLCAQVPGPEMADALIDILNDEDPEVRVAAAEALEHVGYERYAEVARAIDRAFDRKVRGPAMSELPWLLAEIGEPSALGLIKRFLEDPAPEVIASAIEALVVLGEPDAISVLEPFEDDDREVSLEDLDETTRATLGELAAEAIAALEVIEKES